MTDPQALTLAGFVAPAMAAALVMLVARFVPDRLHPAWRGCAIGLLLAAVGFCIAVSLSQAWGIAVVVTGFVFGFVGMFLTGERGRVFEPGKAPEAAADDAPPADFTIRYADPSRDSHGNYQYLIHDDRGRLVAFFWHDFRGDEHGVKLAGGRAASRFHGRMIDFLEGGGPLPLVLSATAVAYLQRELAE